MAPPLRNFTDGSTSVEDLFRLCCSAEVAPCNIDRSQARRCKFVLLSVGEASPRYTMWVPPTYELEILRGLQCAVLVLEIHIPIFLGFSALGLTSAWFVRMKVCL